MNDESPLCRVCLKWISLDYGGEWPEDGPICYTCLDDENIKLRLRVAQLEAELAEMCEEVLRAEGGGE